MNTVHGGGGANKKELKVGGLDLWEVSVFSFLAFKANLFYSGQRSELAADPSGGNFNLVKKRTPIKPH
jgi:hypothetical protein